MSIWTQDIQPEWKEMLAEADLKTAADDGLVISFSNFAQPEIVSDQLPIYFPAVIQDDLLQELGQIKMTGQSRSSLLATENIFINANNYNDFARLISTQFSDWPADVVQIPGNAGHDSYIFQDTVFVVGDGGVSVYHLQTNEINFLQYNQIFLGGGWFFRGSAFNNDYVYFLGDRTLAVLDMTNPVNPVTLTNYTTSSPDGWWDGIKLAGDIAFVGGTHGVTSFDLSVPAEPREIGFVATGEYIGNLYLVGDALYGGQRNYYIFDVSDPEQPQVVSVFSGLINGFLFADFLIGSNNGNVVIFDVTDPFNPLFVKEISVAGNGRVIGVRDNHLYVGSSAGIFVFAIVHNR